MRITHTEITAFSQKIPWNPSMLHIRTIYTSPLDLKILQDQYSSYKGDQPWCGKYNMVATTWQTVGSPSVAKYPACYAQFIKQGTKSFNLKFYVV